jgi:membrane protein
MTVHNPFGIIAAMGGCGWQLLAGVLQPLARGSTTLRTLRQRFREDHLALTAGSLTFTTLISLVPLVTVMLAVFTAFPMFGRFQVSVQQYFVQALVPDHIARPVLQTLTQFAGKASKLGSVGLLLLGITALALMLTIDRTLNGIWRVPRPRPLAQRVLVYWAALTLGPLLLGVSLSLTSVAVSSSRGLVSALPGGLTLLIELLEFSLLAAGMALLFRFMPNTHVRWRHAWAGAVFVALGFEVAKRALGWYVKSVPGYAMVYGAFATLPIFLLWIYLSWLIVLFGAVIAAYLPALLAGVGRRGGGHGWQFQLALETLQALNAIKSSAQRGLSMTQLAQQLDLDPLQLEPVLETLVTLDWIGRLNEIDDEEATRYVLLADVQSTALEPLMRHLLLPDTEATARLWRSGCLSSLYLKDVV